ncbi:MAG: hypothetical protein EOM21_18555 [Gammaproteobacteria bacterium]|nr:hypothetical protein [Gammaproteobacteria bacterium]
MSNVIDAILQERDRLQEIKAACGDDWNAPAFVFYRAAWQDLMSRANNAIGGRLDVVETLSLLKEMQEFES